MNRIRMIILFFILLGFVIFLGGELPYFLFYVFVLSVLIPLIHSIITIIRLDGKVLIPEKSFYKGDDIEVYYQVNNRTPFLIPYLIIDSKINTTLGREQSKIVTSISGRDLYQHSETINLQKRGYFEVGEMEVTIQDIFKIFKFKKKISSKLSLLVYPRTIKLSSFRTSSSQHQGELISNDGQFEDKTRINTLRDYVEGDSIKSMHWKLTAKRDQPMIKVYDNRVDSKVSIFVDNSMDSYKDDVENRLEDKAVDVALSIIDYSLNNSIDFTLLRQDQEKNPQIQGKKVDDMKIILEILAKLKANGTMPFYKFLLNEVENIDKGSSVIVITPNLNRNIGAIALELLSRMYKPFLIIVGDVENNTGFLDEDIRKKLIRENIPIYHIDYYTSIKVVLEDYRE